MNKLQEIVNEFQIYDYFIVQDVIDVDKLKEKIISMLVEYARSVAPRAENEFCKGCGRPKHERPMMLQRIDQDLQSLTPTE